MAFLAAGGQMSAYCRAKTCEDAGRVLAGIRFLGMARPGGPAAGLADGFILIGGEVPAKAGPVEPGRDVPAEIMRRLCANLPQLEEVISNRETRVAVELLIDTGRRPPGICTLEWDWLARGADGTRVLVYDNANAHRMRRRLPVSDHTATLITEQKLAVRQRFPDTSPGQLKLLPSRRLNPIGSHPVTEDNLIGRHRIWIDSMGPLLRADGTEYGKSLITPYSYRHSYAQRHADAGIGIDALRELMDHTPMDTTKRYFWRDPPPRSRRQGDRDAVRPARQPDLARRPRPAGLRTRPLRRRRGRRPLRDLHPASRRPSRRRRLPDPVPLRRL